MPVTIDRMDTRTPPAARVGERQGIALSTDCTVIRELRPTERLLFAGESTCVGTFFCDTRDPLFDCESPSTAHCIVFSRTPVWIHHEQGRRYVADPTVVTFHNRGRVYRRWKIGERGDRCDWIAYSDDVVRDAVSDRPTVRGRDPLWFPGEFAPVAPGVYARQRRLVDRLGAAAADPMEPMEPMEIDEEAALLLDDVLTPAAPRAHPREFDAVQHVRSMIAASPRAAVSLRALAEGADMTPFHLCRAFRRVSGETMTSYRLRLRLLASLESVRAGGALTDVALAHGFSSHSHYTAAFRAAFGITPRMWR